MVICFYLIYLLWYFYINVLKIIASCITEINYCPAHNNHNSSLFHNLLAYKNNSLSRYSVCTFLWTNSWADIIEELRKNPPEVIIINTTEVEIEQPKKGLRILFRKEKRYTVKAQVIADYQDCNICVAVSNRKNKSSFESVYNIIRTLQEQAMHIWQYI